jgi:hypothetical protein
MSTLVTYNVTTPNSSAVQFPSGLNTPTVTATNATIDNLITGNLTTPQGGPIEIGKYVDFHSSNSIDYNARIEVLDGSVVGGSAFNLYAGSFNSAGPITAPGLVLSSGLSFGFSMTTFATGLKLKVANLPLSDDSTRDILRIEGVAGPWTADAVSFGITIQNRSGPRVNVDYGYTFGCSFELWTEVDGTVSVWATLPNGFFNMQFNVVSSSNCTIYPQGVGGTPTGTLLYATPVCTVNSNTSAGAYALRSNTTGAVNTSFGLHALYSNTTGSNNTGVGKGALEYNTTGYHNTGVGVNSLRDNTTGYYNTGVGLNALVSNTTGYYNTGIGISALASTTTGSLNVGIGVDALGSNSTGTSNAAIGVNAMQNSTSAGGCVAVGKDALRYVTTGNYNIAVGHAAGSGITSGISNISIGGLASNDSYTPAFNITTQNDYASFGSTSLTNAYIQVAWTTTSDVRYKTDFAEVPHGLDFLTKVTPTAFRYKQSKDATEGVGDLRYGFKAQEILALEGENPVIIDVNDPDTLRFKEQSMLAVMVNAIKELKVELDNLKSDFDLYKSTHP